MAGRIESQHHRDILPPLTSRRARLDHYNKVSSLQFVKVFFCCYILEIPRKY